MQNEGEAAGADIAITGGVHSASDALKALMAGARVAMLTSALLKHGIDHLKTVRAKMVRWMEEHGYSAAACGFAPAKPQATKRSSPSAGTPRPR
jgi:dihydroorotate dehydrogenase